MHLPNHDVPGSVAEVLTSRAVWQAVDAAINQPLRLAVRAALRDALPATTPFLLTLPSGLLALVCGAIVRLQVGSVSFCVQQCCHP